MEREREKERERERERERRNFEKLTQIRAHYLARTAARRTQPNIKKSVRVGLGAKLRVFEPS